MIVPDGLLQMLRTTRQAGYGNTGSVRSLRNSDVTLAQYARKSWTDTSNRLPLATERGQSQ